MLVARAAVPCVMREYVRNISGLKSAPCPSQDLMKRQIFSPIKCARRHRACVSWRVCACTHETCRKRKGGECSCGGGECLSDRKRDYKCRRPPQEREERRTDGRAAVISHRRKLAVRKAERSDFIETLLGVEASEGETCDEGRRAR